MENEGVSKVLKNTMALYFRMFVLTVISLFTYRIVFSALGADDYGTYNVVGGFVSMFGFVSGTMTVASQRYFAIGLAKKDWDEVNISFSVNLVIYAILSVIILFFAETIGLWFVTHKLNVDYSNMTEIIFVYEASVMNFLVGMIVSPFLALLVADENIILYSWMSIVDGAFKIAVAYILYIVNENKLIVYSVSLLVVTILVNSVYLIYCKKRYKYLKFVVCNDRERYKSVFFFINWNLIGAIASVCKNQGINIIVNVFFGTLVNAARAVAYQLNSVISSFTQNFMKAVNPRITKKYAAGENERFIYVIYTSSKISYYLLLLISIPFIINVEYVLQLWLGDVPEYTVEFTILALVDTLILSITDPILTAVQAIGKVKRYQLTVGVLSLLNLPVAYVVLKITHNVFAPFVVAIVIDILITMGRLINFKLLNKFSICKYSINIFLPAIVISVTSYIASICLLKEATSFGSLVVNVMICLIIIVSLIWCIGLSKNERYMIKNIIPLGKKEKCRLKE